MDSAYQDQLYDDLMSLVESSEAFYFKDFEYGSTTYRIFNYRLASYSDFLLPGALECRGVMFELDENGVAYRLASLPMEKFFNLHENPMTMDVDTSNLRRIMLKADGSLISSYLVLSAGGSTITRLKSKGSVSSEQCLAAMQWLCKDENLELKMHINKLTSAGYTVNMEWCSPVHRIVIGYEKPHLTILNVRNNVDGEYVYKDHPLVSSCSAFMDAWVDELVVDDNAAFVSSIPDMEKIEGYVVEMEDGQKIKIKTTWYLTLHRSKDSVTIPRRLYEAVLEEATDDLRSLFFDDPGAIKIIEDMEALVDKLYNHNVDIVERFYERNKLLSRKDYAILGQNELPGMVFSLAMSKYLGKKVDYKDWMKRHYKDFGIKDEVLKDELE